MNIQEDNGEEVIIKDEERKIEEGEVEIKINFNIPEI